MGRETPQGPMGASKVVPQQQQLGPLYDLPATPQVKRDFPRIHFPISSLF